MNAKHLKATKRARWRRWGLVLGSVVGVVVILKLTFRLPSMENRSESTALSRSETSNTKLGVAVTSQAAEHTGRSAVLAIGDPRESFAARVALVEAAEKTLDVQYYIWHEDTTGTLLLNALRQAAQRGVRIRLLLDDNGIHGIDHTLAALDAQENIEIRLFNPFVNRRLKKVGYLFDFRRLNRRMHNKALTADSQVTVVGGRNVGDEYFGATTGILKVDLDVMLAGPIVDAVSQSFDAYWASESAYPIATIAGSIAPDAIEAQLRAISSITESQDAKVYLDAIAQSHFLQSLQQGGPEVLWTEVRMVADDPSKGLQSQKGEKLLIHQLDAILATPERSLFLISPYFVPGKRGTEAFIALAHRGVDVRILTNSLEATDVAPVHAGYAKRRKALLEGGVRLFEMKLLADQKTRHASAGTFGSSASSLHAKTFAVDSERAFVGSFNLDPRSVHLNTELGFVIESPELARQIEQAFAQGVPERAYEAKLDTNGDLYWVQQSESSIERLDEEPNSGWYRRTTVHVLRWLPIEWLL